MDAGFFLTAAIVVCTFYLLAAGLNLQFGVTGLLNLGVHGFFALGAYTYGLLTQPPGADTAMALGLSWPVAAAVAVAVTGCASVILILPVAALDSRSRSPYLLALCLLAVAETFIVVLSTRNGLAGGFGGLFNIPQPFASVSLTTDPAWLDLTYLLLAFGVAILVTVMSHLIVSSPFGRCAKGIRDDEVEMRALGRSPLAIQATSAAIGGCFMGLAGVLWAGYLTTVTPSGFTITESLLALIAVILGGRGSVVGCVIGSIVVYGVLDEAFRLLPSEMTRTVPNASQILLGVILILLLRYRTKGVWPERPRSFRGPWRFAVSETALHVEDRDAGVSQSDAPERRDALN